MTDTSSRVDGRRHHQTQPPTWAGIPNLRWYLTFITILILILVIGGAL